MYPHAILYDYRFLYMITMYKYIYMYVRMYARICVYMCV